MPPGALKIILLFEDLLETDMPKPPPPKTAKSAPRAKAQKAEHVHASRVAAHLDPAIYTEPKAAAQKTVETAEAIAAPAMEAVKAAPDVMKKTMAPVVDWFGEGFARMASAVEAAQTLAKEGVESFTASRADTTNQAVALQQKALEMAQANVSSGIAAVQKLMSASNVNEALTIHSDYARDAIKTLSDQAKELQTLSAKLAEDAHRPIAAHWSKTAEVLRGKAAL